MLLRKWFTDARCFIINNCLLIESSVIYEPYKCSLHILRWRKLRRVVYCNIWLCRFNTDVLIILVVNLYFVRSRQFILLSFSGFKVNLSFLRMIKTPLGEAYLPSELSHSHSHSIWRRPKDDGRAHGENDLNMLIGFYCSWIRLQIKILD